jgi:hypothetical protein
VALGVTLLLQPVAWPEVALAFLNVVQVVLLAWIAQGVSEAKHERLWRVRRGDDVRLRGRHPD